MTRLALLLIALVRLSVAAEPPAAPPAHLTFRNNLLPGTMTRHLISRTIRRTVPRAKYVETLTYSKRSDWVQCNVSESKPGQVKVYQMMVDKPTRVLKLFHDKKQIEPTPDAASFNLIEGSTSLYDAIMTPCDAPSQAPLTEAAEREILRAMLDFAHWPKQQIEGGHRWQRDLDLDGFKGTQTLEFLDIGKLDAEMVARVTLFVEGQFTGPLEREFTFGKAQAIIYWSRVDRSLVKIVGQANYDRKQDGRKEEYDLRLTVTRKELRALDEGQQEVVLKQLNDIAGALTELNQNAKARAIEACRRFRRNWPDSIWMPANDSIEKRAAHSAAESKRLTTDQLSDLIGKSVIAWEASRANEDDDLRTRTQRGLEQVAREYSAKLRDFASSKDEALRGRAAFALSFGTRPADLALVQKAARDESQNVRLMAITGLVARRGQDIDIKLLLDLFNDKASAIRRRACEAVTACIPREHEAVATLIEPVSRLMIKDRSKTVRRAAVAAVAAIGSPVDIPKLEKALTNEVEQTTRSEILNAIEKLKKRDR